jgi:hypothetical protein
MPAPPPKLSIGVCGLGHERLWWPIRDRLANPDHARFGRFARLQDVLDERVVVDRRQPAADRWPEVARGVDRVAGVGSERDYQPVPDNPRRRRWSNALQMM